eukprot:scaffold65012_cov66-Phaeocystis_antarctica.AAC.5
MISAAGVQASHELHLRAQPRARPQSLPTLPPPPPAAGWRAPAPQTATAVAALHAACWGTCPSGGPSAGSSCRSGGHACEGCRRARARPTSASWRAGGRAIGAPRAAARGLRPRPRRA